jgi:hypothetical protein
LLDVDQNGMAGGQCAVLDTGQTLTVHGLDVGSVFGTTGIYGQAQDIGNCCQDVAEAQGIGLLATQDVSKDVGPGGAGGGHTILINNTQSGGNLATHVHETTFIDAKQSNGVGGGALSQASTGSSLDIQSAQGQLTY